MSGEAALATLTPLSGLLSAVLVVSDTAYGLCWVCPCSTFVKTFKCWQLLINFLLAVFFIVYYIKCDIILLLLLLLLFLMCDIICLQIPLTVTAYFEQQLQKLTHNLPRRWFLVSNKSLIRIPFLFETMVFLNFFVRNL